MGNVTFSRKPWRNFCPKIRGVIDNNYRTIEDAQGYFGFATDPKGFSITGFITKHDADLMTAAPDLYEAGDTAKEQMRIGLSAIQKLIEAHPENKALKRMEAEMKQAIQKIEQALAKARGEKSE